MADKQEESRDFKLTLDLVNSSGDAKSRSISFPILDSASTADIVEWFKEPGTAAFIGKWKYIVQPTNWRDSDDTEEAYQCTACHGEVIITQRNILDNGM